MVMMEPGPDDTSSLTLKLGGGYEAPWLVFKGTPSGIRRQLLAAFGAEDSQEGNLIELAARLSVDAQAAYTLASGGAQQLTDRRRASYKKAATQPEQPKTPEQESAAEADRNVERLISAISEATTPQELKLVWAKNQEFFSDKRLQNAYKAKSTELK